MPKSAGYIREIDSLRAAAVFLVLAHHWGGDLLEAFELGSIGVRTFFTISGFLITGILLEGRERIRLKHSSLGQELKTFFARRTLRIFPVYYATLIIAALLGSSAVRASFGWHVAYLSNIYLSLRGSFDGVVTHLWSLSVEEQFYLVWPFAILLVPRRKLLPFILAVVALGPLFRFALELAGATSISIRMLTPSAADALGLGALLAYARQEAWDLSAWILPAALAGALLCFIPADSALYLGISLLGFATMIFVTKHQGSRMLWVLRLPPVLYLGTISYGIYLLHPFAALAVRTLLEMAGVELGYSVKVPLALIATFAMAAASWTFFESPINSLKRFFPYRGFPNKLSSETPAAVL